MWTNGQRSAIEVQEERYENPALKVLLTAAVLIPMAAYAQPRPGIPTNATVITKAEIDKISSTDYSRGVPTIYLCRYGTKGSTWRCSDTANRA